MAEEYRRAAALIDADAAAVEATLAVHARGGTSSPLNAERARLAIVLGKYERARELIATLASDTSDEWPLHARSRRVGELPPAVPVDRISARLLFSRHNLRRSHHRAFVETLLAAFRTSAVTRKADALPSNEILTNRELDVLRYLPTLLRSRRLQQSYSSR